MFNLILRISKMKTQTNMITIDISSRTNVSPSAARELAINFLDEYPREDIEDITEVDGLVTFHLNYFVDFDDVLMLTVKLAEEFESWYKE
jgi:hypothetical protein